jgi:hypothetical protein
MALPDPFTIAAAAPTPSLVFAKIRMDGYGAEYTDTGGNGYTVVINHTPGKNANRHYVKLTQLKNATNPYTGLTTPQTASVSLSIVRPSYGYTDAEMAALVAALIDVIEDAEVTATKLLQMQS